MTLFSIIFQVWRKKDAKPLPRINVFWVVASLAVTYYVEILHNIMENDNIKRWLSYGEDWWNSLPDFIHTSLYPTL